MKKYVALISCVLTLFASNVYTYRSYQLEIPNGASIPSPCNKSDIWPGVGHELILGSGPRNLFGKDFLRNGNTWTKALCQLDSDGDGKTNGQEVGDPDCVWKKGATPAVTDSTKLTHPGICEPIDSPKCAGKVNFLTQVDSCRDALNMTNVEWCPAIKSPDVQTLTIRFDENELSPEETHYMCQTFQVPDDQQYHIIAWEPIISNPDIMHHLILFVCDSQQSLREIERTKNYTKPMECDLLPPECPNNTIGWAFGMGNRCYGPEAGMPMGKDVFKKIVLQIHYNNHLKKSGYRDSSGLKIYYTAKKRPNDIGLLAPGQYDIGIPPRSPGTNIIGRAFRTKECSYAKLGRNSSYKIMSMLFHMHGTGTHAKLTILKSSGKNITLVDSTYVYDHPNMMVWELGNQPVLESGDNIVIECFFQSSDRSNWTVFGEKTSDEMCLAAIEVYPRPREANYVELGEYGLDDDCDFQRLNKTGNFCTEKSLQDIMKTMYYDRKQTLAGSCGGTNVTDCCSYLNRHNVSSFDCVYSGAYYIASSFVRSTDQVNKVHANMINCIAPLQIASAWPQDAASENSTTTVQAGNATTTTTRVQGNSNTSTATTATAANRALVGATTKKGNASKVELSALLLVVAISATKFLF